MRFPVLTVSVSLALLMGAPATAGDVQGRVARVVRNVLQGTMPAWSAVHGGRHAYPGGRVSRFARPVSRGPNPHRIDARLDERGRRIDAALDAKGRQIDHKLDRRAARALADGDRRLARVLDRRGDRIRHELDLRGDRIERHLDRLGDRNEHGGGHCGDRRPPHASEHLAFQWPH
jgi:hypothetical protein